MKRQELKQIIKESILQELKESSHYTLLFPTGNARTFENEANRLGATNVSSELYSDTHSKLSYESTAEVHDLMIKFKSKWMSSNLHENINSLKNIIKESIRQILKEEETNNTSGQSAGSHEVDKISLQDAKDYLNKIELEIPNFDRNFKYAQKMTAMGRTQRKDMPVINDDDVKQFQTRLKNGTIDINKPFAKSTNIADPFPEGLSGFEAEEFLERGLKDGQKKDDKIELTIKQVPVKDLKPIQKQIYFDKSVDATAKHGVESSKKWISGKTFFITSSDNYIIDGHHRWMSALLIDPLMSVNCLSIDLPISKLLPLATSYGDAIGNKRNQ